MRFGLDCRPVWGSGWTLAALLGRCRLVVYRPVVCPVIDVAAQLAVMFPYSHIEQARPRFRGTAAVWRMALTHHDFEVGRRLDHIDNAAFIFQRRQAVFVYRVRGELDRLILGLYLAGDCGRGRKQEQDWQAEQWLHGYP